MFMSTLMQLFNAKLLPSYFEFAEICGDLRRVAEVAEICGDLRRFAEVCGGIIHRKISPRKKARIIQKKREKVGVDFFRFVAAQGPKDPPPKKRYTWNRAGLTFSRVG